MGITGRTLGDVAVFDIAGDLTRTESPVPTLHDLARARLREGTRKVLFNFEKAEFVDSFGVGEIFSTYTSTQNLGGMFKLCCVPKRLYLILTVVGIVPRVITVYADEAAALTSFADPAPPEDPTNK